MSNHLYYIIENMDSLYIFVLIGLLHSFLYLFHTILSSCSIPYTNLLRTLQLEIDFLRLRWYTTLFNQTIKNWTTSRKRFWHLWFDTGICVTILILPLSLLILIQMTSNVLMHQPNPQDDNSSQVLQLVIPGVDIPMNEVGFYITALLLSTTFHEMGHALAAVSEDVRLYETGFILFFIISVAYVQICNEKLLSSPARSQLRIMCAGVWHNIILAMMAMLLLSFGTWLYKPFFSTETGVSVRRMLPNSPLIGSTGLMVHDTIYRINDCSVNNSQEWINCVLHTMREPNPGYCASEHFLEKYKKETSPNECCDSSMIEDHLCFKFLRNLKDNFTYSCLPARTVITQSEKFCRVDDDCLGGKYCLKPLVENSTKVVQIQRIDKKDVLFIGYPADIFNTVVVSDWVSKFAFLSSEFPENLNLVLGYIVMFSSGLAVINVIPCFYFDGQYIVDILISLGLQVTIGHQRFHRNVCLSTKVAGTLLLAFNVLYMLFQKFS
ncbi:membrane-bound transcription factor site-2 protease [Belonocnema kinseyi]|uniref:membrane-bound transcription factor site-2 protease n=1 Tax=Belonocnema kinseyi TaxID=2817044 RepID=UPI00143DAEC2|nr:membrane-bound transcription factor site-2 protease [Belonocnema kinseyi]XP_033219299.1 membrane-bound transcription factor site-2 protease [Belonocnema kinseyi]